MATKEQDDVHRIGRKLEKIISRKDSSVWKPLTAVQWLFVDDSRSNVFSLHVFVGSLQSCAQALDLLKALQSIPINLEVLQKTRIGMTVNNLRKSIKDEDVTSLSKSLIKSWKKLLPDNDSKGNPNPTNGESQKSAAADPKKAAVTAKPSPPAPNNSAKPAAPNPPFRQTSFPANTTNEVRLKCREMLTNVLKYEDSYDADETLYDPEELAAKIEDYVFKEFKDTNAKYKNRIRSRVSNLKDPKNPDLKLNVLRGSIKPEKIAVMTADVCTWILCTCILNTHMNILSGNGQQRDATIASKVYQRSHQWPPNGNDFGHQNRSPQVSRLQEEQLYLQSGNHINRLHSFSLEALVWPLEPLQVQTRSADEPMTTFCFCNECGKRWKFCWRNHTFKWFLVFS